MDKVFLLRSALIILVLTAGCGNPEAPDQTMDSSLTADSFLRVIEDSTGVDDKSGVPEGDTTGERRYYGEDYDGDTVLYEENGKVLGNGTVTGRFVEIQRGDYLHLILRDQQGMYHSFWILFDDPKLMDEYWEGKQPEAGQKIRVHWLRTRAYMYEAGSEMVIYKMTELEALDN